MMSPTTPTPPPSTMTAVVTTGHGGPEVLEIRRDVLRPDPGPDELLVEVTAAGLNNTDVWSREGSYATELSSAVGWRGVPLSFPRIQGGDLVGRVVAVGTDVDDARVGERVLIDPATYPDARDDTLPCGLLGSEHDGAFAQYATVSASAAHEVGSSPLTDAELAALPIAYGTAWGMLDRAELAAGDRIVVTGASGGVGLAAVQLGRARDVEVVAVTRRTMAARVRAAGAHRTVERDTVPAAELADAVGELDAIIDVVAGPQLEQLLPALAEGGRAVISGAMAGAAIRLDVRELYLHQQRLIGSTMHTRRQFRDLVGLANAGRIRPPVEGFKGLGAFVDAQRAFLARDHVGKVVVMP